MVQILEGKKKVFFLADAPDVIIQQFRELRTKNILKSVLPHEEIEKYLPDKGSKHYNVDQNFILRIIKKLEPVYFEKIHQAARDARYENLERADKTATITMTKATYELIMSKKFVSGKLNLR